MPSIRLPVTALIALLALPAVAAETTPPAEGNWSLGAGVGFGSVFSSGAILGPSTLSTPAAAASVERRLSEDLWLVVGGLVAASRTTNDANAVNPATRDELVQGAVVAGVRRVMTPHGAPVTVSWTALGRVDLGRRDRTFNNTSSTLVVLNAHERLFGVAASFGIAIERELTDRLALRASTPLLSAGWSRDRLEASDGSRSVSRGASVVALVAPSLELRMTF